jgi:hypothetical protein
MAIIPSSKTSYAYFIPDEEDKREVEKLQNNLVYSEQSWDKLKGVCIEISKDDQIPDNVKPSLVDGKFFVIK